tara:strand:- start:13 stop:162 length:150 start_codon:yes stop_codon:yes gene_type:complete
VLVEMVTEAEVTLALKVKQAQLITVLQILVLVVEDHQVEVLDLVADLVE